MQNATNPTNVSWTCSGPKYEYYIYGVLGLLLAVSEGMGLTKAVNANGLLDLVISKIGPGLVNLIHPNIM